MDPKSLAAQLRCPSGQAGIDAAGKMNQTNKATNFAVFAELAVVDGDSMLEIGPGNGGLISTLLADKPNVRYTGIDWSQDMVEEARRLNRELLASNRVSFVRGSSECLPFADGAFNKAFSVHTIYFWQRPEDHLAEIARVLRPNGRFCLCFGDETFMRNLPFARYGFQLYETSQLVRKLNVAGFHVTRSLLHEEIGESNAGEPVRKQIKIIVCSR